MIQIKLINSTWPPSKNSFHNVLVLNYDDWNDFGYRTSFGMYYCDQNGNVTKIGALKIFFHGYNDIELKENWHHTKESMDNEINHLDNQYCSLGQELSYYKNLKEILPNEYRDILQRLNDIAFNSDIKGLHLDKMGVQTSLLRFSSAVKAFEEAAGILNENEIKRNDFSFEYLFKVPYDESPTKLSFDFLRHDHLPYRINVLIGKNGTGKTQILSRLANSLSGYTDKREYGSFPKGRPSIDKVMSISYSAFDSFKKPMKNQESRSVFSYIYCGIQSETGTLSIEQLRNNFKESYNKVVERERIDIWQEVLGELMEEEHRNTISLIQNGDFEKVSWSSGQHILISTITEVIANIENESMILFDEPEIHLHPNALSNVMRMFYLLLERFDSYAIVSTHSPVIVQEIPSQYIHVLDRQEDILTIRHPDIECFGNNISDIITDVFDVSTHESNYKTLLKNISHNLPFDSVRNIFNDKLSFNALIFLKNCYMEKQ